MELYSQLISNYPVIPVVLAFCMSFYICWRCTPTIVHIARTKDLIDKPNDRSSHRHRIPNLGGVGIFIGFSLSSLIFVDITTAPELQYLIAGLVIIFFIGLKDDIQNISPRKKLAAQILSISIAAIMANIRFTSLHGFMGIHHIPFIPSLLLTVFVAIVIINSFNLIDGIDGLSSGLGIISSSTLGTWFFLAGASDLSIACFALAGVLVSFFYYNVFGLRKKTFMGDTGSLLLGFIITIFIISFNELNIDNSIPWAINAAPAVSFSIIIVPLFDTLRVFTERVLNKKSPFSADKRHVHHRILALGNNHLQTTLIICSANILFIIIAFIMQHIGIQWLMLINLSLASLLSYLPVYLLKKKDRLVLRKV